MNEHQIEVHDNVKIIGTNMTGIVKSIGQKGLIMLRLTSEHSIFDRTVYHPNELERL